MTHAAMMLVFSLLSGTVAEGNQQHGCHSVHFPTKNTHRPFKPSVSQGTIGDLLERGLQTIPETQWAFSMTISFVVANRVV